MKSTTSPQRGRTGHSLMTEYIATPAASPTQPADAGRILYSRLKFSNSSSLLLYCSTRLVIAFWIYGRCGLRTVANNPRTMHTPSRLVFNAGTTSLTVRSTRTPPTNRKHFRSGSSARASSRVESTKLRQNKHVYARTRTVDALVLLCLLFQLSNLAR